MHFEDHKQPEHNDDGPDDLSNLRPVKPGDDLPSFDTSRDDPAIAALRPLAASGDGDAMLAIAQLLFAKQDEYSIEQGARWLTLGEKRGHAGCSTALAVIIENSIEAHFPIEVAMSCYEEAAEQGDFRACYRLAKLYEREDNPLHSREKALECLFRATEGGVPEAMFDLGMSLFNTTHGVFNPPLGLTALHKAAATEYVPAFRELGALYFKGEVVPQEPAECYRWLRQGAARGDAQSVFLLGALYLGSGGAGYLDLFHACSCLLRAAEMGYPGAGSTLASLYTAGHLSTDDPQLVEKLESLSASMREAYTSGASIPQIDEGRRALLSQVNNDVGRAWNQVVDEGDRGDIDSLVTFAIHMNNPAGPESHREMGMGIIEHLASEKGQEFADRVLEISRRFG